MERGGGQAINTATLNLILGIFLKLLGFFVVMYSFTEIDPLKAHQAEASIRERFNISINLVPEEMGASKKNDTAVQTQGRSYTAIEDELKTQVDFLSSSYEADSDTLVLHLPLNVVLAIDGKPALSQGLAQGLAQTLNAEHDDQSRFTLEIIAIGDQEEKLIPAISLFVQKMVGEGYDRDLLTIGYQPSQGDKPMVELRIKQVPA